jgi:hypothetical protein
MDEYGFIQGFKYDNLYAWNIYQRQLKDTLHQTPIKTDATLYYVNEQTLSLDEVGRVELHYENHQFIIHGALEEVIPLAQINNPTVTMRRDFTFFYQDKNYLFKMDHFAVAFLRIAQDKY